MTTVAPSVEERAERTDAPLGGGGRVLLAVVLALLALTMAASAILGPLVLGLLRYRTSPTTLNQLEGSDAAVLFVVVPATILAALLAARRHPAAPPLAAGIAVFALYTYAQVIIGQEYLRLPGNVERFFPLLLAVFVLAEAALVLGWRSCPRSPRPRATPAPHRGRRPVPGRGVPGPRAAPAHDAPRLAGPGPDDRVRVQPDTLLAGQAHGPRRSSSRPPSFSAWGSGGTVHGRRGLRTSC